MDEGGKKPCAFDLPMPAKKSNVINAAMKTRLQYKSVLNVKNRLKKLKPNNGGE
jgi:hypothetical protein